LGARTADCAKLRVKPLPIQEQTNGAGTVSFANGKLQTNILKRQIYKPSQTLLGSKARSFNVAGAFEAKKAQSLKLSPQTGATTASCARALKKAGFENIKICALLYELPASAALDMAADKKLGWRTELS